MAERRSTFKRSLKGVGFGAAVMYFFDPDRGKRRRAWVREQAIRTTHATQSFAGKVWRDSRNRAFGFAAATRALVAPHRAGDELLHDRVRAAMGRMVRHPHALMVLVRDGRVALEGPVLADEVNGLIKAVAHVRGVRDVENRLQVHTDPDAVPGLQGEVSVPVGQRRAVLGRSWPPATRFLVGTAGGALAAWGGSRRRTVTGMLAMAAGGAALTRALTNLELKRLLGIGAGRRAVEFHRTWDIAAPVDRVYAFWNDFQNLARDTSLVSTIEDLGDGRTRWKVAGPGGLPLEWTAVVTKAVANRVIAWRTEPDSAIQHIGEIRFQERDGGTAIHLWFAYNPVMGALGHGVGTVLGADAQTMIEQGIGQVKQAAEAKLRGSPS